MEDNIVWENEWANYMAMDEDGRWYEYHSKPCLNEDGYYEHSGNDNINAKRKEVIPIGSFDWKDSLIKKESNTEMKIKTIQLYETSDNSVFRDIKEAEEHQKLLNLADFLCDILVEKSILHRDSFKKAIMKNKEEITKIIFY